MTAHDAGIFPASFGAFEENRSGSMETVIIVVHLMLVLALVGVVLLQKSEGGALGMGGGGGGLMGSRGTANVLTRATAILGAGFFATSLILAILAGRHGDKPSSILDGTAPASQSAPAAPSTPAAPAGSGNGILDQLEQMQKSKAPAAPAAPSAPQPAGQ